MNRKGFSIYLTFLVTTVIFLLVITSYDVARNAVDIGRTIALSTQAFHAADGGIERGLGKLRNKYDSFKLSYWSKLDENRRILVSVEADKKQNNIELKAKARVFEGERELATCLLLRPEIKDLPGRRGIGRLMEAS